MYPRKVENLFIISQDGNLCIFLLRAVRGYICYEEWRSISCELRRLAVMSMSACLRGVTVFVFVFQDLVSMCMFKAQAAVCIIFGDRELCPCLRST
jgi:hypothetical protein